MKTVVIASNNKNKIYEFNKILSLPNVSFISMGEAGFCDDIVEDGNSFEENALIKARAVSQALGCVAISDDSGLEVEALNNEPGIYSARYAGGHDDNANNALLIKNLQGIENRNARYVCAICICYPNGDYRITKAYCNGRIIDEPKGQNGFGYDPYFYVDEFNTTLASVTIEQKNTISHRAKAIKQILEVCDENLNFKW